MTCLQMVAEDFIHDAGFIWFLGVGIPTRHVFLLIEKTVPTSSSNSSRVHVLFPQCSGHLPDPFFNCENCMFREIGFVAHVSPIEKQLALQGGRIRFAGVLLVCENMVLEPTCFCPCSQ